MTDPVTSVPDVPHTLRAYVNERGVDVPHGGTALDAVRAANAEQADAVVAGARVIVDSRGLPIAPDTPAHGGAIYRTITARHDTAGDVE